jgi:glycerophosphoryl diester phosphodiesterase
LKPLKGSLQTLEQSPQWLFPKKAPIVAAAIMLLIAVLTVYEVLDSVSMEDNVEISAHRGASLVAPENTLSAVRQAVAQGATYVEIDVQRTSDGMVVVAHDADLMRVGRQPLVISKSTLERLRQVDVGSHFAPEFAGEHLPSLAEVIDEVRGRAKLIIELKSYSADPEALVLEVVRILKTNDFLDEAVIMSLEYRETQMVRRLDPELEVGFTTSAALGDISKLDVDFLAVSRSEASNTLIATAHAQDKEVYVWTVDKPVEMASMIDRGVDNIITNDPAKLVTVLEEREDLTTVERILLRFASLYR